MPDLQSSDMRHIWQMISALPLASAGLIKLLIPILNHFRCIFMKNIFYFQLLSFFLASDFSHFIFIKQPKPHENLSTNEDKMSNWVTIPLCGHCRPLESMTKTNIRTRKQASCIEPHVMSISTKLRMISSFGGRASERFWRGHGERSSARVFKIGYLLNDMHQI